MVFGVGVSSAVKWSRRQRATGSAAAKPMGGTQRDAMAAGRSFALARLAELPSLSLQVKLAEREIKVSYSALWSFVDSEGLRFKKTVLASETERLHIAQRRDRRTRHQKRIDPHIPVFIDEILVKTNMAPLRGWSSRGKRLPGRALHGHWRTQP